jgi:hypothetical protein
MNRYDENRRKQFRAQLRDSPLHLLLFRYLLLFTDFSAEGAR